jgi:hypothetical protein
MANYRRELNQRDQKLTHVIYKNHVNNDGGIFTKDKRRKLLGLRQEHGKYFEDTADFWYDVRSSVKTGLKDLELFFSVAHPEQIREVIFDYPKKEEADILKKTHDANKQFELFRQIPSLNRMLSSLFEPHYRYKTVKSHAGEPVTYSEQIEEEEEWKPFLLHDIIKLGIEYLESQNFISSKAHQRLTEEFLDMINVEIARGSRLRLYDRLKGFV